MPQETIKTETTEKSPARSLAATLAFSFVTLSVVALLISSGLQLFSNIRTHLSAVSRTQALIGQDAANKVSRFIEEKFDSLETPLWFHDPIHGSPKEQRQFLESILGLQPAFRRLALLNAEGRPLAQVTRLARTKSPWPTDQLPNDVLFFIRQRNRYISPVYIDQTSSEPVITMAVPVTNAFREVQGTLVVEVNLKFMWNLVDHLKVGRTGYAFVVDRWGTLIAFGDTARVLRGESAGNLAPVAEFVREPAADLPMEAFTYRGITGSTVVGVYVPLRVPDWAVVTAMPWGEAYGPIIRDGVVALGIMLVMVALSGLLGVYVARRLSFPLVNLMETATRISGGERNLQATVSGPTEVAALSIAFNSMTAQLRRSLEELEQRFTQLQQAEEALRINEERLRLALEGASDGIWDWDTQAGQAYFSPRYYTMLGYEPGEFPASYEHWRNLLHPDDASKAERVVQDHVDQRIDGFSIEVRMKTKSGEWLWVQSRGKAVERDTEGKAVRVAGSHSDISGRKQAEQALLESEQRFRTLAEASFEGIALTKRGVFTDVNDQFVQMMGYDRKELIGKPVADCVAPEHRTMVADFMLSGRQEPYEHLAQRKDGTIFPVEIRARAIQVEGEVIRVTAIRDVALQKESEERIRRMNEELEQRVEERTTKLEAANRELEAFSYSVSHDLRAPLRAIDGYARILMEDYAAVLDAEGKRVCLVIHDNTLRMGQLIDDLLAFSRLSRAAMQVCPIDMAPLVRSVFTELAMPGRREHIHFKVGTLPSVMGDPNLIRQVWTNLLSNAIKFSSRRDQASIEVDGQNQNGEAVFSIRDNGSGFDMRYVQKLFGVFQRLHSEKEFKGTGVGLAIVQRIIHRHGGRIWAEGAVDHGATFYFTLPRKGS